MNQDLHLLCAFSDRVLRGFRPELDVPLNRTEVQLIVLVNHQKNKPMKFYGSRLNLEKGSFTYVVDSLEDKGYVNRVQSEEDKRSRSLVLTEKGQELANDIKSQHDEYINEKLEVFTDSEVEEIEKMTSRFSVLLEKLPEQKGPRDRRHRRPHGRKPKGGRPGMGRPGRPEDHPRFDEMRERREQHRGERPPRRPGEHPGEFMDREEHKRRADEFRRQKGEGRRPHRRPPFEDEE